MLRYSVGGPEKSSRQGADAVLPLDLLSSRVGRGIVEVLDGLVYSAHEILHSLRLDGIEIAEVKK